MSHKSRYQGEYAPDWPEIAERVKDAHGWRCERCGHEHNAETGHVLTVHHLDGNKANNADWNLACLCQRCHLHIQGRVFHASVIHVRALSMVQVACRRLLRESVWGVTIEAGTAFMISL